VGLRTGRIPDTKDESHVPQCGSDEWLALLRQHSGSTSWPDVEMTATSLGKTAGPLRELGFSAPSALNPSPRPLVEFPVGNACNLAASHSSSATLLWNIALTSGARFAIVSNCLKAFLPARESVL